MVIGDLGLARSMDTLKSSKTFAGSINYISPEIIKKENYKYEVDIWYLIEFLKIKKTLKRKFFYKKKFLQGHSVVSYMS